MSEYPHNKKHNPFYLIPLPLVAPSPDSLEEGHSGIDGHTGHGVVQGGVVPHGPHHLLQPRGATFRVRQEHYVTWLQLCWEGKYRGELMDAFIGKRWGL